MPDVQYWNMPYTAQQIEDALAHAAPRINASGNWEIWNMTNGVYADTGVSTLPLDPHDPYIGQNLNWYVWDKPTQQYVDSGVVAGYVAYDGSVQEVV